MKIPLRELTYGPCPYLSQDAAWRVAEFTCRECSPELYESILVRGFRRSGTSFYRTICEGCSRCIPIRIDSETFEPTPSQLRVLRRGRDLSMTFETEGSDFREDRFRLYEEYCRERHGRPSGTEEGPLSYASFLLDSPLGEVAVTEYRLPSAGGPRLAGNGYLDILPGGLSSVYFAWDSSYRKLSLGTYSILREIELCRKLGKRWYYLGFWVPGSPSMDYKSNFRPAQIALDGRWVPLDEDLRKDLRGCA